MLDPFLLGVLLVISFLVAFSIGGNDEAMAPAVGAKVFTVRAAVLIGAVITVIGAISMGGNVSEKVGSDMVGGMEMGIDMVFAILISMAIWLLLASVTKGLPISTTQCIVGSVIGVAIFAPVVGYSEWGFNVINWYVVLEVFMGWILSPLIGFFFAAGAFGGVSHIDTFDPKPAKSEIQGPVKPLATNVTGLHLTEHLPQLAKQMDKFALIRSMTSNQGDHPAGQYLLHRSYLAGGTVTHPTLAARLQQMTQSCTQLQAR